MKAVFADTSAFLALLNATDTNHTSARRAFAKLHAGHAPLVSTSFVLVETYALLGRRFGLDAVMSFRMDFAPLLEIVWVDGALHDAGLDLLLEQRSRRLSLVDAVSLVVMRQANMVDAFAFDSYFENAGFSLVK